MSHYEMLKEVTREEIKKVMFAMSNNKVSGPNGFRAYFFKKA